MKLTLLQLPPDYGVHTQKFTDIFRADYWEWVWNQLVQQTTDQVEFIRNVNNIGRYLNDPEYALFTFLRWCVEHKDLLATTATLGAFIYLAGGKKLGPKLCGGSIVLYAVLCVLAMELRA